jgi:hypothetical protein
MRTLISDESWIRGADAAYREEQFQEEPRNPYKKGTARHAAWQRGYDQWSNDHAPDTGSDLQPRRG